MKVGPESSHLLGCTELTNSLGLCATNLIFLASHGARSSILDAADRILQYQQRGVIKRPTHLTLEIAGFPLRPPGTRTMCIMCSWKFSCHSSYPMHSPCSSAGEASLDWAHEPPKIFWAAVLAIEYNGAASPIPI